MPRALQKKTGGGRVSVVTDRPKVGRESAVALNGYPRIAAAAWPIVTNLISGILRLAGTAIRHLAAENNDRPVAVAIAYNAVSRVRRAIG
jgi:hypothetical protein